MIYQRLVSLLNKYAGPKTVVALVMAILPFNALFFPIIGDQLETMSGFRTLDIEFSYSPEEVFARLNAYGYSGRLLYLLSSWTIDFLYPLLYSFLFAFMLTFFLQRAFSPGHAFIRLQSLPFVILFFDLIENGLIAFLLAFYPAKPVLIAIAASFSTTLKWCFAGLTFAVLVLSIAVLLYNLTRASNMKGG